MKIRNTGPGPKWITEDDVYIRLLTRAKHKPGQLTDLDRAMVEADRRKSWTCRDAGPDCEGKAYPCRRCGVVLCHYHHHVHRKFQECLSPQESCPGL